MARTITITLHRQRKVPQVPAYRGAAGVAWVSVWDRKVLMLLRGDNGPHPNTWCFPAGKLEEGESAAEGACREFREETGCWNSPSHRRVSPIWAKGGFSLFLYLGSKFGPIIDGESNDYMWASIDNPPAPLHPGVAEQLEAIAAALLPYDIRPKEQT